MWDHFFPLLFPKDSESLKILDIQLREVGAKRPLNGTSRSEHTDRHTDRRTFWLIESIGPEGRCFENHYSKIIRARKLKFKENVHLPLCVTLLKSHVTFHVSHVTYHMSDHHYHKTVKARSLQFWDSVHHPLCVTCHMTWHISCVACHLSPIICNMSHGWSVCHPLGTPRLVLICLL